MGIFESRESRNRKLFQVESLQKLPLIPRNEHDLVYSAWGFSGAILAEAAVDYCPYLIKAWGKGDIRMASDLRRAFTIPLVYRWYKVCADANFDKNEIVAVIMDVVGYSNDEQRVIVNSLLEQFNYECSMLEGKLEQPEICDNSWINVYQNANHWSFTDGKLQGNSTTSGLIPLINLQRDQIRFLNKGVGQYNYPGLMVTEAYLVMYHALECIGKINKLAWSEISFPLKYMDDSNRRLLPMPFHPLEDVVGLIKFFSVAIKTMFDYYDGYCQRFHVPSIRLLYGRNR